MKRTLLWISLSLVVLLVTLVSLVTVRTGEVEPLPPPDPSLAIELPGGASLPLGELLDRANRGLPLPLLPPAPEPLLPPGQPALAPNVPATTLIVDGTTIEIGNGPFPLVNGVPLLPDDPVYALAEIAQHEGRHEQALALYLSVPDDSKHYARARRTVAWEILTRDLDRPDQAVEYANQALHADPFDGNAWQDWARVYGCALGLPVD